MSADNTGGTCKYITIQTGQRRKKEEHLPFPKKNVRSLANLQKALTFVLRHR